MGIKSRIISAFAARTSKRIARDATLASKHQAETFNTLIKKGTGTVFGKDHHLKISAAMLTLQGKSPSATMKTCVLI
jgi:hypothetical protein